jgi:5'-3' exoribonuclease 1
MYTLPHTGTLGIHGVNVFNVESQRETMMLNIANSFEGVSTEELAEQLIGTRCFVGWPFLIEAYISCVNDEMFQYVKDERGVFKRPQSEAGQDRFYGSSEKIESVYSKRFGTIIGPVETLVGAKTLNGSLRYLIFFIFNVLIKW